MSAVPETLRMIIQHTHRTSGPSFSLSNRVRRQLWNWVWLWLFRPSLRPMHAWRAALLRLFGARLGRDARVYPAARIWAPWNLVMGEHTAVADGVTLYNISPITLGDYAIVSQGSHLCTGSHDYNSETFQLIASPITLERHVWVCAEAFISPGVTLPEGAVIAPRTVVTKPLRDAWTVYGGTPARPIGQRRPQP
ncbi:putative colanic acid biosynthesis acetyltransferase WcaF [Cupriavidus alkaliphilus]|nr:putative colanic acid biosynthesis acetyltransferase WcaF [Cupriavidus alkaliphilus]RAS04209.1 putative colanic acid biosynthesis acetyltransferase WcaF [Cupriavidus alkaliphilus]SCB28075.1 putative colanic acid biosynthesis acetyltransferase WcaF [Cupriavidus alkaliphilus]